MLWYLTLSLMNNVQARSAASLLYSDSYASFFFRRNVKMTCNTRHILCLLACLALKQHLLLYFLPILLKWPTKYTINDFVFSEISENSTKILKIPRRDTVTVIFRRPHLFEAVQQSAVQQTVDAFSNVAMRDALCSL